MATIRQRGPKRFQVCIRRRGFPPQYATFTTQYEARRWARQVEAKMDRGIFRDLTPAETQTVAQLVTRYVEEAVGAASRARERSRAKPICAHLGAYAAINLAPDTVAQYRDRRLRYAIPEDAEDDERETIEALNQREHRVGPQTVIHEMKLLSGTIKLAMAEWGIYLPHGNPASPVKRPKRPQGRTRRTDEAELARVTAHSDCPILHDLCLFAVETAMRRGELAALRWSDVNLPARTLHVPKTKTGVPRTVPLSGAATAILRRQTQRTDGFVWGLAPDSITQAFSRARDRAAIVDLHFHDLRHEAASRLIELGLGDLEVAAITGHADLQSLKRYAHLRTPRLVAKLDRADRKIARRRARAGAQPEPTQALPDNVVPFRR